MKEHNFNITVEKSVINFIQQCIVSIPVPDPAVFLTYGRFSDEIKNQYRISIIDSSTALYYESNGAKYINISGVTLLAEQQYLEKVKNKIMVLKNDVIDFKDNL